MREIAERIWREPAVAIGLLVSILLAVINLGEDWDAATITSVLAPVASALGIRALVTPTRAPR